MSFQNWHEEFDEFRPENFTWMVFFWTKAIMFEVKMYISIMFDGTGDWCKIWRKTDFYFPKWHQEFGKFSPTEK